MFQLNAWRLLIPLGFVLVVAPSTAVATPVHWAFEVQATGGPLAGAVADGTFTYDSSIIPSGGGNVNQAGLLTQLDFTWNGIHYDETTANTGFLGFSATGELDTAGFGTNCTAGLCSIIPTGQDVWDVTWNSSASIFFYITPPSEEVFAGNLTVRMTSSIPEPGTLWLVVSVLIGLGLDRSGWVRRSRPLKRRLS